MTHAPTQLGQDPQYEAFLFAPVGEDRRGDSVTVLSMLARLGVDPWSEAAGLARLPKAAAGQRLEALMARFKDVQTRVADRSGIISGLLDFLPKQTASRRAVSPPQGFSFHWIIATALFLGWIAMLAQGQ